MGVSCGLVDKMVKDANQARSVTSATHTKLAIECDVSAVLLAVDKAAKNGDYLILWTFKLDTGQKVKLAQLGFTIDSHANGYIVSWHQTLPVPVEVFLNG